MAWMALLITVFLILGLRDRTTGGSTHLTILVVSTGVLAFVYLTMRSSP